jgi:hypothetical protein
MSWQCRFPTVEVGVASETTVKIDTDRTKNGGSTIGSLGRDTKDALYPLSDNFEGDSNPLAPGTFPEAERLKQRVGDNAHEYMTRLRTLKSAYEEAEAAMNDIANGFVEIEEQNIKDASKDTLGTVLGRVSSELGFPNALPVQGGQTQPQGDARPEGEPGTKPDSSDK